MPDIGGDDTQAEGREDDERDDDDEDGGGDGGDNDNVSLLSKTMGFTGKEEQFPLSKCQFKTDSTRRLF